MNWLSANYKWLFSGIGGAVAIVIITFVLRRLFGSKSLPQAPTVTQTASPSMDNRATQTASPHIEQHQHLHIGGAAQTPTERQPQRHDTESAILNPQRTREVWVYDVYGVLKETPNSFEGAYKAIVLPFKNMPKAPGQHTPRAGDVSASLVFKNADGSEEISINHGVWLGRYQYSSTFSPSETHELLVALKKDESFITLENPTPSKLFIGGINFKPHGTIVHPQIRAIWTEGTIEIVLIDGHGVTLFQGVFDSQLSGEKMALTPKNLALGGGVHFVPDPYNHGWSGDDGRTDIRVAGIFTYDGKGMLTIVDAFLKGTTPWGGMRASVLTGDGRGPVVPVNSLELHARTPVRAMLDLLSEPTKFERGKPIRGRLVFRDVYNKEYEIDPVDFPWIGPQVRPAGG